LARQTLRRTTSNINTYNHTGDTILTIFKNHYLGT
jgi:hypothetical protein